MMKKFWIVWLVLPFLVISWGCEPNDDFNPDDLSQVLIQGDGWHITYFWDEDKDETYKFNGWVFQFQDNGVFRAVSLSETRQGTWTVNPSSQKLIIDITGFQPLDELNDDWLILEQSDTLIKLRDDNDTHLEELHFQKLP